MGFVDAIVRSLDDQSIRRRDVKPSPLVRTILQILAVLSVAAFVQFFVVQLGVILESPTATYRHPSVYNLTSESVTWDVYYGDPVACGEIDCHLTEDYPKSSFGKSMVLPAREFPLADYKPGQTIYYRTRIVIPQRVLATNELLLFHSVYVWARRYEMYVGGHLIDTGGERLISAAIPPYLIGPDGSVDVAFKIDPGTLSYQGLAHYGEIIVGPQSLVQQLAFTARDVKTSYYLIYIIPRLTLAIVFALLFLTMSRKTENAAFAVFAVVSSASLAALSNLKGLKLEVDPMTGYNVLSCWTAWLFLIVVHTYFRRLNRAFPRLLGASALYLAGLSLYLFQSKGVSPDVALKTMLAFRVVGYGYALYLASTTAVYLYVTKKSAHRLVSSVVLVVFMACALTLPVLDIFSVVPGRLAQISTLTLDTLLMIVLAGLMSLEFRQTVVQRDFIRQTFRSLVDSRVADQVLEDQAMLQPQDRVVTVMFCDIRSFTQLSERITPAEVFDFLNRYFGVMVDVILSQGGTIDKFGGDSIMAVWGAPLSDPEHATKAIRCALAMRAALADFNDKRVELGLDPIAIGIGVHSGPVISGTLGTKDRAEYTVIGDTVNIASRLEGLTKELRTDILASGVTSQLAATAATFAPMGDVSVKGRSQSVSVFRVAAGSDAVAV